MGPEVSTKPTVTAVSHEKAEPAKNGSDEEEELWQRAETYAQEQGGGDHQWEGDLPEGEGVNWTPPEPPVSESTATLEELLAKIPPSNRNNLEEYLRGKFIAVQPLNRKELR